MAILMRRLVLQPPRLAMLANRLIATACSTCERGITIRLLEDSSWTN